MPAFATKLAAARNSPAWQLALDKFPLSVQGNRVSMPERKLDAIKPLTNATRYASHWTAAIKRSTGFLKCLEIQHGARFRRVTLINSSRLLLHLGRASVLENVGLYCDRTTGLPVIPGSAVKGVISTWACWEAHLNEIEGSIGGFTDKSVQRANFPHPALAQCILGDNSGSGSTASGGISFLGAWPEKPPVLGLDIVTPHHNNSGQDRAPKPNPFLCIEPGTVWQFALLASPRNGAEYHALLNTAERWLSECLGQSGLGAKTAAGYGRFVTGQVWNTARQSPTSEDERRPKATVDERLDEVRARYIGDYTEELFKNRVLDLLNQPGKADLLKGEIKTMRENGANAPWIAKLTVCLQGKEMRDVRKRLKEKEWFPKDWLFQ